MRNTFFRCLTAMIVAAASHSPAYSDWKYHQHESEFDGTVRKGMYAVSEMGNETLIVWAHPDTNHIAMRAPRIVLDPKIPYICNTSESGLQWVDYITFDADGTQLLKATARFDVSTDGTELYVRNASNPSYNFGPALLNAMNDAAEIRFRFTDDCGTTSITKFKMVGFKRVASDIGYDYY